eukprot:1191390-Prorocentrum_minimum.AAC.4
MPVPAQKFNGSYFDPNCPYGWRSICAIAPNACIVAGKDSNVGNVWWCEGVVKDDLQGEFTITVDLSGKSKGKLGILVAKLVEEGLQFPDGIIWKRFDSTDSTAAEFEGAFTDPMYPRGWRTIIADGADTAVVVGLDASVGTAWWSPGITPSLSPKRGLHTPQTATYRTMRTS